MRLSDTTQGKRSGYLVACMCDGVYAQPRVQFCLLVCLLDRCKPQLGNLRRAGRLPTLAAVAAAFLCIEKCKCDCYVHPKA